VDVGGRGGIRRPGADHLPARRRFAGIALLAPRLVQPLARVVGWPASRAGGVAGEVAGAKCRHESVITALIGATLGLGLGLFLAVLGTQAMPDLATMTIPWLTLGAFTVVAVVAGIGTAILPARRAARLNVLDAVQYE